MMDLKRIETLFKLSIRRSSDLLFLYNRSIRNQAMAVSHEIKSQLAKLLATEDLVVEHKRVETACFNVHTRVLTLPMWEQASGRVYDMLVSHEVGHALYTPDSDWFKDRKIPPQFVNVVEDVRIEKLMKRRYAGISKTFYRGYQELSEEDFFQIADENLNTMNLADKANLHFKIGNFVDIDFSSQESVLIDKIATRKPLMMFWMLLRNSITSVRSNRR